MHAYYIYYYFYQGIPSWKVTLVFNFERYVLVRS